MELKSGTSPLLSKAYDCSNCTFMELKCNPRLERMAESTGSNCTFMELKSYHFYEHNFPIMCSNCTFMELK